MMTDPSSKVPITPPPPSRSSSGSGGGGGGSAATASSVLTPGTKLGRYLGEDANLRVKRGRGETETYTTKFKALTQGQQENCIIQYVKTLNSANQWIQKFTSYMHDKYLMLELRHDGEGGRGGELKAFESSNKDTYTGEHKSLLKHLIDVLYEEFYKKHHNDICRLFNESKDNMEIELRNSGMKSCDIEVFIQMQFLNDSIMKNKIIDCGKANDSNFRAKFSKYVDLIEGGWDGTTKVSPLFNGIFYTDPIQSKINLLNPLNNTTGSPIDTCSMLYYNIIRQIFSFKGEKKK